ncbi:hypothetical protein BN1723_010703 [Verticillium longisporum]|nr:hypothetical protein BN1723_010703 [Verticillium longisporum]CRK28721.1 hypothetical protein BN1708_004704 [Verticillium longisporum]
MSAIPPHEPRSLRHMSYTDAVCGTEIYNFYGNRALEHTTATGTVLAIKVKPLSALDPSEADMMQYAATKGILAPNIRGVYDIVTTKPIARVLVSERVPGVPLVDVWLDMEYAFAMTLAETRVHAAD